MGHVRIFKREIMTDQPEKETWSAAKIIAFFGVNEETLSNPPMYKIIAKRERYFIDNVLIPFINKEYGAEGFECVRVDSK